MKQFFKDNGLLIFILCVGVAMRFYHFADWSLSNDELSALSRLQFENLSSVIENGVRLDDMHPMGVQVFLWFWTKLFGITPFVVRLPFVILGCFSLVLFYLIAREWIGVNRALLALSIFACSQFPILYSQLARPYSPGLFFSLLFVLAWTKIVLKDKSENVLFTKWNIFLVLGGVGAMYSHYFSFLFVGLVGLAGFFFINENKKRLFYLISGALMFLLYIPNFNVFLTHFSVGGLGGDGGWLGPPGQYAIFEFLFYSFNNDWILVTYLMAIVFTALSLNKFKLDKKKIFFLSIILGLLPVLIAYFYSLFKNPVFQYSILIFGYPLIIIGVASLIDFRNTRYSKLAVLLTTLLFFYSSTFSKKYYSTEQFAVFKNLVADVIAYTQKYGENNIEYTANVIKPYYFNYYFVDDALKSKFVQYRCNDNSTYQEVDSILQSSTKKYFLHAWSNNYHAPELEFRIRKYFPYLIKQDIHFNSGIYLFAKEMSDDKNISNVIFEEKNDFEKNYWNLDEKLFRLSDDAISESRVSIVDSSLEYGATYTNSLQQIRLAKNKSLVVELKVKSEKLPAFDKFMLVVEVDSPDGKIKVWRSLQFQPFIKKENQWTSLYYGYKYVENILPEDIVKIYVYNPGKYKAEIDDMIIRVLD
ncbi:MAG: glycosyltransferase family 39 protein [Bacteroidota bacterium]|jgi:hypothetical protein